MNNAEKRLADILATTGYSKQAIAWALHNEELGNQISELVCNFLDTVDFAKLLSDGQLELFLDNTLANRPILRNLVRANPREILDLLTYDQRLAIHTSDFGLATQSARPSDALLQAADKVGEEVRRRYLEQQRRLADKLQNYHTLEQHESEFPGKSYTLFRVQGLEFLVAFKGLTAADLRALPRIGNATILKLRPLLKAHDCDLKEV